jgi:hypothetical protein
MLPLLLITSPEDHERPEMRRASIQIGQLPERE